MRLGSLAGISGLTDSVSFEADAAGRFTGRKFEPGGTETERGRRSDGLRAETDS